MTLAGMLVDAISRVIIRAVGDSGKVQFFKIEDETPDDDGNEDVLEVESLQNYGVASRPPEGSEGIVVNVDADGANRVCIAAHHRDYRPRDLEDGEVCLYTKDGKKVYCKVDGITYVGDDPDDFVANARKVDAEFERIWDLLTTWTVAPNDGGAALQASANFALPGVQSVACAQLKAK